MRGHGRGRYTAWTEEDKGEESDGNASVRGRVEVQEPRGGRCEKREKGARSMLIDWCLLVAVFFHGFLVWPL